MSCSHNQDNPLMRELDQIHHEYEHKIQTCFDLIELDHIITFYKRKLQFLIKELSQVPIEFRANAGFSIHMTKDMLNKSADERRRFLKID